MRLVHVRACLGLGSIMVSFSKLDVGLPSINTLAKDLELLEKMEMASPMFPCWAKNMALSSRLHMRCFGD